MAKEHSPCREDWESLPSGTRISLREKSMEDREILYSEVASSTQCRQHESILKSDGKPIR
jgi:hypothetical protein